MCRRKQHLATWRASTKKSVWARWWRSQEAAALRLMISSFTRDWIWFAAAVDYCVTFTDKTTSYPTSCPCLSLIHLSALPGVETKTKCRCSFDFCCLVEFCPTLTKPYRNPVLTCVGMVEWMRSTWSFSKSFCFWEEDELSFLWKEWTLQRCKHSAWLDWTSGDRVVIFTLGPLVMTCWKKERKTSFYRPSLNYNCTASPR